MCAQMCGTGTDPVKQPPQGVSEQAVDKPHKMPTPTPSTHLLVGNALVLGHFLVNNGSKDLGYVLGSSSEQVCPTEVEGGFITRSAGS